MIYEHEKRERTDGGEIQHVPMPSVDKRYGRHMHDYLTERGLDYSIAQRNGWYPTVSRGSRIVIPCVNSYKFNYWQARAMDYHNSLRYDSPAIPRKDSIVFLWPIVRKPGGTVIITEGPMDALGAAEHYPAIAVMGGSPSEEVLAHIERKTGELGLLNWVLVPDSDNLAFIDKFLQHDKGLQVVIPSGKDLAGMPGWERSKLLKCGF